MKLTKNKKERQKMRVVGQMAAEVLEMLHEHVKPGVTTLDLNDIAHEYITKRLKAIPAPLNYKGFPRSICTSVNDVACHGIPDNQVLVEHDMLNIDVTVIKDGFHGDTSRMYFVGNSVEERIWNLTTAAHIAMWEGIRAVKPGEDLGKIGEAIEKYIQATPYCISPEYTGHGIGKGFHEYPPIFPYAYTYNVPMVPGMTFTIEPIINEGTPDTTLDRSDGWTVRTRDGKFSAQYEHTILVTKTGYEVLTLGNMMEP